MKDYEEKVLNIMDSAKDNIRTQLDKAYKSGYADAKSEKGQNIIDLAHNEIDRAYQQGLEDAWEVVKKLVLLPNDGGLEYETITKIFDSSTHYTVLKDVSVSEAIAKIKEYENEQKQDTIQVGDEVYSDAIRKKAIVTYITDDGNYIAITSNGSLMIKEGLHRLHKTGRHFDQIAEVLSEMRGEE